MNVDETHNPVSPECAATDTSDSLDLLTSRHDSLIAEGYSHGRAFDIAYLEQRLREWPAEWGNSLNFLIYGDFRQPSEAMDFPEFGIRIHNEKVTGSVVRDAMCVLRATITVEDKTIPAVLDAASRIDALLGILCIVQMGNLRLGWWSWIVHPGMAGVMADVLPQEDVERFHEVRRALANALPEIFRKIKAVMFWIREPQQMAMEGFRSDVLRVYAGYWNAFECLVDIICLLRPPNQVSRSEKQAQIDKFLAELGRNPNPSDITNCYRQFVNPSFVAKASHALRVCFDAESDHYIHECFHTKPKEDRLYDVRNAINHGTIDAGNLLEVFRVEEKFTRLRMIVHRMLGRILPIGSLIDPELQGATESG